MELNIYNETEAKLSETDLKALFNKITIGEKANKLAAVVNLIMTDDARIQELNRDYRQKDSPTDVLSFNIDKVTDPDAVLGEIYISTPTATRQALEQGVSEPEEINRLFVHGLLHLLGYDHIDNADAQKMVPLEASYLGHLGGGE